MMTWYFQLAGSGVIELITRTEGDDGIVGDARDQVGPAKISGHIAFWPKATCINVGWIIAFRE